MSEDVTNKAVTDSERMKELEAQVLALEKWKNEIIAQQNQPRPNAPIGTPLQGVLGPTAQLAIDRAARPPDVNQLDLIRPVAGKG
jgi:hypothetical protein